MESECKKAFVAGGTSGIGLEIARLLYNKGLKVTVSGRKFNSFSADSENDDFLRETVFIRQEFSPNLKESDFSADFVNAVKETDILCVNYGPFIMKSLESTCYDEWNLMAYGNLALPGYLVSLALPEMIKRKNGRILLTGGNTSDKIRSYKNTVAYACAKTGLTVLAESLKENYSSYGIKTELFLPGYVTNVPDGKIPESPLESARRAVELLNLQPVSYYKK